MKRFSTVCIIFLVCITSAFGQEKIIFDTDFGGDADDLGALAMLHNFMDKGECEILAVMVWNNEEYALSAIDAVNLYYGHPNIPRGARKKGIWHDDWQYSKPLVDTLNSQQTFENVPTTTTQYRQMLSNQPDSSITIITVGPLLNIKRLIESSPDHILPYSGRELIFSKVKEFVIMGGEYPSGEGEWNFDGICRE